MKNLAIAAIAVLALCATGCNQDNIKNNGNSSSNSNNSDNTNTSSYVVNNQNTEKPENFEKPLTEKVTKAGIKAVKVTKVSNGYKFYVSIESNDKGCQEYVDWWEVLDKDGNLLYRRILKHSHVKEQPFTRFGVITANIDENQALYIRAHLNTKGYNGSLYMGNIKFGFVQTHENKKFDSSIESADPQPLGCAF